MQVRRLITTALVGALVGPFMIGAPLTSVAMAQTAPAKEPTLLKQNNDWYAFSHGTGNAKVCFAMTVPKASTPAGLNHGDVRFFVTSRPAANVRMEPSIRVGYNFQENSKATVDIDGQKFTLFTKGDGAWVENASAEPQLIAAMKKGKSMKVAATSGRGNATGYTFSLSGITATLNDIQKACP
ncbi:Invasion protein IalB, involved in pathogenesis [Pseudoxanthobacter soli DSM 19599]|uniref:Invasion protein IalB, involved in pathogenesis n=2 Tax=Pseudoxanthobacter TaxID=433838 RepID=A0A1M7ZI99_9HYPH|nr:Invasion protein IalB, involved in pathogenesis [Pseudoxanthobacter soli DSM 19599]